MERRRSGAGWRFGLSQNSAAEAAAGRIGNYSRGRLGGAVAEKIDSCYCPTVLLSGQPAAANFTFGTVTRLNLTDPDSMVLTPWGDLLPDDQGDGQLVLLRASGSNESPVQAIPLQGGMQVDDTVFVTSDRGYLLIAERDSNTIYKLSIGVWQVGTAFSASTGVPSGIYRPNVSAMSG